MKTCELCRMPAKWHIAAMKPVMGLVATTYHLSCGRHLDKVLDLLIRDFPAKAFEIEKYAHEPVGNPDTL